MILQPNTPLIKAGDLLSRNGATTMTKEHIVCYTPSVHINLTMALALGMKIEKGWCVKRDRDELRKRERCIRK
jgi:hypothetical protein